MNAAISARRGTRGACGLASFALVLVCGCAAKTPPTPDGTPIASLPASTATSEPQANARPASAGSLWPTDEQGYLFSDHKARRVGDLLTVKIIERAEASKDAGTKLSRDNAIDASIENLFGLEKSVVASNPYVNPASLIKGEMSNKFEGNGSTKRSDDLTTQMTVVVDQVLPNGNLVIRGSRVVGLNFEQQVLTLSGLVRPEDIDSQNTVLSTFIANADIRYGGNGVVNDKQRPGWFTWLVDWVWPL